MLGEQIIFILSCYFLVHSLILLVPEESIVNIIDIAWILKAGLQKN